jgi:hypothetical protein
LRSAVLALARFDRARDFLVTGRPQRVLGAAILIRNCRRRTAQSSGANTAPGVTTGAASGTNSDADANAENKLLDKKMKSICRGC